MVSDGDSQKLRVGISHCLLGEPVRYDGGHKKHAGTLDGLGPWVEWVPVCPEAEAGMGVPREAVVLVGNPRTPDMVGAESGREWTRPFLALAQRRWQELARLDLDGFVFKKNSPSCGLGNIAVFQDRALQQETARVAGLFAALCARYIPGLPVIEETGLEGRAQAEAFLDRMHAYRARRNRNE